MTLSRHHAQRLAEARDALIDARQAREDAITGAWLDGASLRDIAEMVGLNHSTVSRLLARSGIREPGHPHDGRSHGVIFQPATTSGSDSLPG